MTIKWWNNNTDEQKEHNGNNSLRDCCSLKNSCVVLTWFILFLTISFIIPSFVSMTLLMYSVKMKETFLINEMLKIIASLISNNILLSPIVESSSESIIFPPIRFPFSINFVSNTISVVAELREKSGNGSENGFLNNSFEFCSSGRTFALLTNVVEASDKIVAERWRRRT